MPNSSARSGGRGPTPRARRRALAHQLVDVAVEVMVRAPGAAAGEREPEDRHHEGPPGGDTGRADEGGRASGQQQ